jgi:hypothetical protein
LARAPHSAAAQPPSAATADAVRAACATAAAPAFSARLRVWQRRVCRLSVCDAERLYER